MMNTPRPRFMPRARTHLRNLADETRRLIRSGFALTPAEREAVLLVCALLVLGVAARILRVWLAR